MVLRPVPAVVRVVGVVLLGALAWPRAAPAQDRAPVVWAAFVEQTGCRACAAARSALDRVRARHPELRVEEVNAWDDAPQALWLSERAGREGIVTPSLFIADEALVGGEVDEVRIEALVRRHLDGGAPRLLDLYVPEAGRSALLDRFRQLGPVAVAAAGLIDGVNPCAFATLIFFVSYLTLAGRRGRELIAVGASFTLGVFGAYLAVGLGAYRLLDLAGGALTVAGRWVMGITAGLCALFAVLSVLDFVKARRGRLDEMRLTLPDRLKERVRAVIRRSKSARAFVAGAFVTGVVVSMLELACTGQVYLPTLVFVTTVPELRTRAVGYLVLYNVLFVVPLIVVFVLAYFGTTSRDLIAFLRRRAAAVKLLLALLYAGLAAWLVWAALPPPAAPPPAPRCEDEAGLCVEPP